MRILYLTREYPPDVYGGAGVHVEYLSKAMSRLGGDSPVHVDVRCFGDQHRDSGTLSVRGYPFGGPHFEGFSGPEAPALRALESGLAFNRDRLDADIVHCHTWYAQFGGIVAKLTYGMPLVVTVHSLEPLRPWKREQLGRGYDVSSWIERTALEMADQVIAVSAKDVEEIVTRFDVPREKVRVIHNGLDVQQYQPVEEPERIRALAIDPSAPYVLFLGRMSRQKGITHFLRAAQQLPQGVQTVLCAASPDTREVEAETRAQVQALRDAGRPVIWINEMLDRETAIALYSHASVFCCPSVYEPFGIINLEAMACETPVVASAVGGILEVVVHEQTGYLIDVGAGDDGEPTDPDRFAQALAAKMSHLIEKPLLAQTMGRAGRQRVIAHFRWEAIAERTLNLYGELLAARGTQA